MGRRRSRGLFTLTDVAAKKALPGCHVPVSEYFELQGHARRQAALVFHGTRWLAGPVARLRDEWKDRKSGERLKSYTIVIAEPNAFIAEVHDRMPALLTETDYDAWLGGSAGVELLKPAAENRLQRWPVSKRANSSKALANDPTLIDRIDLLKLPVTKSSGRGKARSEFENDRTVAGHYRQKAI